MYIANSNFLMKLTLSRQLQYEEIVLHDENKPEEALEDRNVQRHKLDLEKKKFINYFV